MDNFHNIDNIQTQIIEVRRQIAILQLQLSSLEREKQVAENSQGSDGRRLLQG